MSLDAFSSAPSSSRPSVAWSALLAGESSLNFELFSPLWTGRFAALPQAAGFQMGPSSWRRGEQEHFSWAATLRHRVLGLASRLSLGLPSSRMKVFEVSAGLLPLVNRGAGAGHG